ncbi:MAG: hypothetical protein CL912_16880 [Deltaproteobacteria bacterium]|nr:hypothetical protein [Deltaproteobacteria bacterium]
MEPQYEHVQPIVLASQERGALQIKAIDKLWYLLEERENEIADSVNEISKEAVPKLTKCTRPDTHECVERTTNDR